MAVSTTLNWQQVQMGSNQSQSHKLIVFMAEHTMLPLVYFLATETMHHRCYDYKSKSS